MKVQRLRRGLTLKELAAKCTDAGARVSEAQLSRIERGIYRGRPVLQPVLARLLDLDVTDFERRAS